MITTEAGAQTGQPFVLDNRSGANGIIGTDTVAKAVADGYTLLHVTASFVINPHILHRILPLRRDGARCQRAERVNDADRR